MANDVVQAGRTKRSTTALKHVLLDLDANPFGRGHRKRYTKNLMTESEAKVALLDAGIPLGVLDVWGDSQVRPAEFLRAKPLAILFGPPDYGLTAELARRIPGLRGLVPIFEQNGEAVVGYLPRQRHYVRFYYEDCLRGTDSIEVVGRGYQQFAATILLEYEEAGLSIYYAPLAELLRFNAASELRRLLDADPYDDDAVGYFHSLLAEDLAQ